MFSTDSSATTIAYWTFDNTYNSVDSDPAKTLSPAGDVFFSTAVSADAPASSTHSLRFRGTVTPVSATVPLGAASSGFSGPADDFTIEFFFKTTDAAGVMMTTFDGSPSDGDGPGGWIIQMAGGKVAFANRDASPTTSVKSTDTYDDNNWHGDVPLGVELRERRLRG